LLKGTPEACCIVISTWHDDSARPLNPIPLPTGQPDALCCCPACGEGFRVDRATYALALRADAAWLRQEGDGEPCEDRCAAWEAEAERLTPVDPRQRSLFSDH
jgi:hypothetical protein